MAEAVPEDAVTPLWATPQNVDLAGTPRMSTDTEVLLPAPYMVHTGVGHAAECRPGK